MSTPPTPSPAPPCPARRGAAIGLSDAKCERAGAHMAGSAEALFAWGYRVVKVKEPQPAECRMLRPGPGRVLRDIAGLQIPPGCA